MPVYLDVSPLHRLATIIVRGSVSTDDVASVAVHVATADARQLDKIIDVSSASTDMAPDEIRAFATALRSRSGRRGPVAFVVADGNTRFSTMFADATREDRPVRLFHSLHDARRWLADLRAANLSR